MTWKYGILQDLQNCGAKGHLLIFIQNYLSNCRFKVRLSTTCVSCVIAEAIVKCTPVNLTADTLHYVTAIVCCKL